MNGAKRVGVFLFDGVDMLCTGGPAAILTYASRQLAKQGGGPQATLQ